MTLEARDWQHAEVVTSSPDVADGGSTLRRLLAGRGIDRYALFFVTGEGRFFPNRDEEISGSVLTPDGRIFAFWTGWDTALGGPAFRRWYEESPEPQWDASAEYQRARAAVGLG